LTHQSPAKEERMRIDWSGRTSLAIIAILTVLGLGVWIGVVFLAWTWLQARGVNTDLWTMLEGLSTAAATAAVLGGGFAAYRQLVEMACTRHLAVVDALFSDLNSEENTASRRWVYQNLSGDPALGLAQQSPEGRDHIKRVLNSLDHVAFLMHTGSVPEEMVMPWLNPMVVKSWLKLGPYVESESKRRGEPDYYANAKALAEHCIAWRKLNVHPPDIHWVDNA
jgi:hypothetical protein